MLYNTNEHDTIKFLQKNPNFKNTMFSNGGIGEVLTLKNQCCALSVWLNQKPCRSTLTHTTPQLRSTTLLTYLLQTQNNAQVEIIEKFLNIDPELATKNCSYGFSPQDLCYLYQRQDLIQVLQKNRI